MIGQAKTVRIGKDGIEFVARLEQKLDEAKAAAEASVSANATTQAQVEQLHQETVAAREQTDVLKLAVLHDVGMRQSSGKDSSTVAVQEGMGAERRRFAPSVRDVHQDDPQKGRWGGSPTRDGRALEASVVSIAATELFRVRISVRSIASERPLSGTVVFTCIPPSPSRESPCKLSRALR